MSVLRPSLRPGLLKALAYNASHRNHEVALFEIGRVFAPPAPDARLPDEHEVLAVALGGQDATEASRAWQVLARALAVADDSLLAGPQPGLHPTRSAAVVVGGEEVGVVGEIDPAVLGDLGIAGRVGWLEVDLGITGWGSRPYPQFYLTTMLTTGAVWNESHFSDAEFDGLAATAGSTLDEAERVEAYSAIQQLLAERGPVIIPYYFPQFGAISDQFTGFQLEAFAGRTDLHTIRLAE